MSDESASPGCPGPSDLDPSGTASGGDSTESTRPDVDEAVAAICAQLSYQAAMRTVRTMRDVSLRDFLS